MPESEGYYYAPPPEYMGEGSSAPANEDIAWKLQYSKIPFESKSFAYLKKKLKSLDIPEEKITDLIAELDIIINNASKLKIERELVNWFIEEFEVLWDNFCIYSLKNHRWIDELNHVRRYALTVLMQELFKSIEGWQGDNLLRYKVEQSHVYDISQKAIAEETKKRGFFRRKEPQVQQVQPVPIMQQTQR